MAMNVYARISGGIHACPRCTRKLLEIHGWPLVLHDHPLILRRYRGTLSSPNGTRPISMINDHLCTFRDLYFSAVHCELDSSSNCNLGSSGASRKRQGSVCKKLGSKQACSPMTWQDIHTSWSSGCNGFPWQFSKNLGKTMNAIN